MEIPPTRNFRSAGSTLQNATLDEELGDQRVGLGAVIFETPLDCSRWILGILAVTRDESVSPQLSLTQAFTFLLSFFPMALGHSLTHLALALGSLGSRSFSLLLACTGYGLSKEPWPGSLSLPLQVSGASHAPRPIGPPKVHGAFGGVQYTGRSEDTLPLSLSLSLSFSCLLASGAWGCLAQWPTPHGAQLPVCSAPFRGRKEVLPRMPVLTPRRNLPSPKPTQKPLPHIIRVIHS